MKVIVLLIGKKKKIINQNLGMYNKVFSLFSRNR